MSELVPRGAEQTPQIDEEELRVLTTPLSLRGWPVWLIYLLAIIGFIYILNPTAGVDLIPDFIPGIGNLDEGVAVLLVWYGLVEFFEGQHYRAASSDTVVDVEEEPVSPEEAE
ncbi:MAG TPA: DUF1232 domain-containing protein [Chloroflexi bacterium]|nr:DUF1232 domain-containing protein [Chloroflexota bacterium]